MYLEKLTISGFKSFAAKTELAFPKDNKSLKNHPITAIVGPNGSGKSNIADAIRWVLGEQSLKLIRCKKSEDIIFSGSERKSRINFAEVSIHFNNESGLAPIDYTQLTITRRLYRNGDSEYLINNNKVRLFDILLLLAKSSIGTKSFSIIGQGMIDSIITCSPQERGDFFNEAVGVKHYQIKRDQSLNKLQKSEENLTQAETVLEEITPHLKMLTKQVNKLRLKETLEKEKLDYSLEYYSRIWEELGTEAEKEQEELKIINKDQEAIEEEMRKITYKLGELENQQTRNQAFQDLQDQYLEINQKKNKLLQELTVLKGKKDLSFQEQGKLDLVWLYRQEEEIESKIQSSSKEIRYFNEEIDRMTLVYKEKEIKLESTNQEIGRLEKNLEELTTELTKKLNKEPLSEIQEQILSLCEEQKKFIAKLKTAQTEKDFYSLEKSAQSITSRLEKLKTEISTLPQNLSINKPKRVEKSEEILFLQNEIRRFQKEKEIVLSNLNDDKVQLKILEEKRNLAESEIEKQKENKKKISLDISAQKEEDPEKAADHFEQESKIIEEKLEKVNQTLSEISGKIQEFNKEEQNKKSEIFRLEREKQEFQNKWNHLNAKINSIKIALARIDTKLEDLVIEIQKEELPAQKIQQRKPFEEFTEISTEELNQKIIKLKKQLEQIGGIDPEIVTEYEQTQERYDFLQGQVEDMKNTIGSLEKIIIELDEKIQKQFNEAFKKINQEFEKYFKILFQGGKAKLTKIVEDEDKKKKPKTVEINLDENGNPIENEEEILRQAQDDDEPEKKKTIASKYKKKNIRGIDIAVSPPGKKLANIEQLSGGERSLVAIALISAIIYNNPSPLVLLDEVDAALDEANSNRIAAVLQDLAHNTQFVLITHNRSLMYIANLIYGVTMGPDSVSRLLSVKIEDVDKHSARV